MRQRASDGGGKLFEETLDRQTRLEGALRAVVEEEMHEIHEEGVHTDPEELLAYQENRVSGPRREEIAEHLSLCPDCARFVLDLAAFDEVEETAGKAEDEPEEQGAVKPGHRGQAGSGALPFRPPTAAEPSRQTSRSAWSGWIAAAAVVILSAGLVYFLPWGEELPTSVGWMYMSPDTTTSRGSGQELELPPGARHVTLVLGGARAEEFQEYRVEVLGPDGTVLWRTEEAEPAPDGTVPVLVAIDVLPSGIFEVQLSGRSEGGWQDLDHYTGRLREP